MNSTDVTLLTNFSDIVNYTVVIKSGKDHLPHSMRLETYFVPVIFFFIFVIGVLGNGTLVLIFMRHRTMRNVPNTYILSLALADLLVILTSVPFTSVVYALESWPWGELICKISETAKDISVGVSVFTLTALSANRFFAIVNPLKKMHASGGNKTATRVTVIIAVMIWVFAGICAIPAAIGSHLMEMTNVEDSVNFTVCYPFPLHWLNEKYPEVNIMTRFLVLYVLPLCIITVFYWLMANHLLVSTRNVPGETQGTHRQIRARRKVAFTVLIFVVIFAVCFLPHYVFMLAFYFYPRFREDIYNDFWHFLRIVGFCLCYINSCVNPVALYCVSGTFRKHFNRYLFFCIKTKRNRCYTCPDHHATTMSTVSTRRNQSVSHRINARGTQGSHRRHTDATNRDHSRETSIMLLGNGKEYACSKM